MGAGAGKEMGAAVATADDGASESSTTDGVAQTPVCKADLSEIERRIDESPDRGHTLLLEAAKRGNSRDVAKLCAAGVPTTCTDDSGHNPLHRACFGGHEAVAQLLIAEDDQCINEPSARGNTPLHTAAFSGHAGLVSLLLTAKADPSLANSAGDQAIHRAVAENFTPVVTSLLAHGASAFALGAGRNTPLHVMALVYCEDLLLADLLLRFARSTLRDHVCVCAPHVAAAAAMLSSFML